MCRGRAGSGPRRRARSAGTPRRRGKPGRRRTRCAAVRRLSVDEQRVVRHGDRPDDSNLSCVARPNAWARSPWCDRRSPVRSYRSTTITFRPSTVSSSLRAAGTPLAWASSSVQCSRRTRPSIPVPPSGSGLTMCVESAPSAGHAQAVSVRCSSTFAERRGHGEVVRRIERRQLGHEPRELGVVQAAEVPVVERGSLWGELHGSGALGPDPGEEAERVRGSDVVLPLEVRARNHGIEVVISDSSCNKSGCESFLTQNQAAPRMNQMRCRQFVAIRSG